MSFGWVTRRIQSFEDKLEKIKTYLNGSRGLISVVSICFFFVATLCAIDLIFPTWSLPSESSTETLRKNGLYSFLLVVATNPYTFGLCLGFLYKWRKHVPGVRNFPYAFTLVKSVIQVGVLFLFTFLDKYLKDRNGVEVVTLLVCLHIHMISVVFAFCVVEDCDVVSAFLVASFTLLYELSKEDLFYIAYLTVTSIVLMWIKNLLLLPPDYEKVEQLMTEDGDKLLKKYMKMLNTTEYLLTPPNTTESFIPEDGSSSQST